MGNKTSVNGQMTFIDGVRVLPSHAPKKVTGKFNTLVLHALKTPNTQGDYPLLTCAEIAIKIALLDHQVSSRLAELRRLGYIRTYGQGQTRTYAWSGKLA